MGFSSADPDDLVCPVSKEVEFIAVAEWRRERKIEEPVVNPHHRIGHVFAIEPFGTQGNVSATGAAVWRVTPPIRVRPVVLPIPPHGYAVAQDLFRDADVLNDIAIGRRPHRLRYCCTYRDSEGGTVRVRDVSPPGGGRRYGECR